MEHKSELVLNKSYDKYLKQDFTGGVDNLNPQREIQFDKLDIIIKKLQEATNDIIRKKIETPPAAPILRAALGGESIVEGISLKKQQLIEQAGGSGILFPILEGPLSDTLEQIIGTSPALPGLDEPPEIDCDAILDNLGQLQPDLDQSGSSGASGGDSDSSSGAGGGSSSSGENSGSGEDEGGEDEEGDDTDYGDGGDEEEEEEEEEDDADEMEACAEIELGWLKLILILVKILKIIQKLITMVLAILIPIIEIVRLAVGAWINPPNIAKIVQLIIQMILAIILMILAMILQMIWNLLNMDCVCDQTASLIRQITKALSTFASLMGQYNALGVNLANQVKSEIMDPLSQIADEMAAKKEAWMKLKDQVKDMFSEASIQKMMDQVKDGVISGVMNSSQVQRVQGLVNDAKQVFNTAGKVKEQFAKMREAANNGDLFGLKSGAKMTKQSGQKILTKYAGLVGIEMTKKES